MFKRIVNLIKGFFSLFIGGIEKRSPEALLEVEKDNLRKSLAKFNQGLASHAGIVEKLLTQTKKLEKQKEEYEVKVKSNLKAGNKKVAAEFALKHKSAKQDYDIAFANLEESEARYKELLAARDVCAKEARSKIEQLRRGIDDMKVQKAVAELNEMASGMVTDMGGTGDNLSRLEEMVEEERTQAAGRARVAKDQLDLSDVEIKANEQEALADLALADFAAEAGIELEKDEKISSPLPTTVSTDEESSAMGPAKVTQ